MAEGLVLVVGSLRYSSWSMRAWLALTHAGASFSTKTMPLLTGEGWKQNLLSESPTGKVPVLVVGGQRIHESLAICEWANERFPEAQLWPVDAMARARARSVSLEMATGFGQIREHLSCHDRARVPRFVPDTNTLAEIQRVQQLWDDCLQASGGPYLFGHFSIADCMYVPMTSRFRTYNIALGSPAAEYAAALWAQPAVQAWQREAKQAPAIPHWDAYILSLGGDPEAGLT
jgi:glutathione S-transferase